MKTRMFCMEPKLNTVIPERKHMHWSLLSAVLKTTWLASRQSGHLHPYLPNGKNDVHRRHTIAQHAQLERIGGGSHGASETSKGEAAKENGGRHEAKDMGKNTRADTDTNRSVKRSNTRCSGVQVNV